MAVLRRWQRAWDLGHPEARPLLPQSHGSPSSPHLLSRRQKGPKSTPWSLPGCEPQGKINFSPHRGPGERLRAGGKYPRDSVSTWSRPRRPQSNKTTLIWVSAAPFCFVCGVGTGAGPGHGGETSASPASPASPGPWGTLPGPPRGKQAPLPISSPEAPGKPASAVQGPRGTSLSQLRERLFQSTLFARLCSAGRLISTSANINNGGDQPADRGPWRTAQDPPPGAAMREGTAAKQGYPSPLRVCKQIPIQLGCWGHSQVKQSQLSLGSKRRDFLSSPPRPTTQPASPGPRLQGPGTRLFLDRVAGWHWGRAEEVSGAWRPPGKRAPRSWRPLHGGAGKQRAPAG